MALLPGSQPLPAGRPVTFDPAGSFPKSMMLMVMHRDGLADRGPVSPWFRRHPGRAVGVAVGLFAAVTGLRFAVHGTTEAITLLYALPIALLAAAFGVRVGTMAGVAGVGLLAAWVASTGATLTPVGWVTRATPILLLGALAGAASDQLRRAAEAERRLVVVEERRREAAEINDAIIQRLVAAKWSLEAGAAERGIELLTDSIETAEALVSDLLDGSGGDGQARRVVRASSPPRRDTG